MLDNRIVSRYAKALLQSSVGKKCETEVHTQVQVLIQLIDETKPFASFWTNPAIPIHSKLAVWEKVTNNAFHPLVHDVVALMINKHREMYLRSMLEVFVTAYRELKQIKVVHLTTASVLDIASLDQLKTYIQTQFNCNEVVMNCSIDEQIIGGVKIELDGKVLDHSVTHKLNLIYKQINKQY